MVAFDEPPHHVGFAAWPEGRSAALLGFDMDKAIDDLAALHQEAVHRGIDTVDLLAKIGQGLPGRGFTGRGLEHDGPFQVASWAEF